MLEYSRNNNSLHFKVSSWRFIFQESESANEEDGSISSEGERRDSRTAPQAPIEGESQFRTIL